ncbi:unnamed protein product [Cyberlindnera jadinii]|uniref:Dynein heavy chain, cytoplasmic n=1 Tax=Cyberlindnera jadinii (strain ATCC 18201 / CBS 1600 / BCRC 20928 / JCM 3617 / NBRC 0987 / NRRL Y-1542) TaxID=983966 RepID=A0A0H5C0S3_CYBJN|nr:unnamed protein product [Cyberlindnera jadinii]
MEETPPSKVIPTTSFVSYLFNLCKALQGAQSEDIGNFHTEDVTETVTEFVNQSLAASLFISKLDDGSWCVGATLEAVHGRPVSTLVVVKEKGAIVESKPLQSQVQVLNLPSTGSSFETLNSLISVGVGSFFTGVTLNNTTDMVATTKKKINELALSFQSLNHMVGVLDLNLTMHPIIKEAVANGASVDNYTEFIPEAVLTDSSFLNSIQAIVNDWVKSIQAVTRMERDVSDGSALDEANFWLTMESSLASINSQLNSTGVLLTLEVLKYAKRYHATVSFMSDVGIKDAISTTADYNKLMKDIPLQELVIAESPSRIQEALILIFNHLKKLRGTSYPIRRALPFVEAISSDLVHKLQPLLSHLMELDYEAFTAETKEIYSVFETWDRCTKEFTNLARELLRKREEKFIFVKVNSKTTFLKDRLDEVVTFRKAHQNFSYSLGHLNLLESELDDAYMKMKNVNVFTNDKSWDIAKQGYEKKIQLIEYTITDELRSELEKLSNSDLMFEVFQKYQDLLNRPRIRGAVQEYQSQLLESVSDEISHLQRNFTSRHNPEALASCRDFPYISYILLWAKCMENKLNYLTDKIELVLGKDWSSYAEGKKIYTETMVFKKKLNFENIFENWIKTASEYNLEGVILSNSGTDVEEISVNFDQSLMVFYKEVRALALQKFAIPHPVMVNAKRLRKLYPHAVILKESFELLPSILKTLESLNDVQVLVDEDKAKVYALIQACSNVTWEGLSQAQDLHEIDAASDDDDDLEIVLSVESSISSLFNKSEILSRYHDEIETCIQHISMSDLTTTMVSSHVSSLQSIIDSLSNDGFQNLEKLVFLLNKRLVAVLVNRFKLFKLDTFTSEHSINIVDSLDVVPPLENHRLRMVDTVYSCLRSTLQQTALYITSLDRNGTLPCLDFSDCLPDLTAHVDLLLGQLDDDIYSASQFVTQWYQFEILRDANIEAIVSDISLDEWLNLLDELRSSKTFFDSVDTFKTFGEIRINFADARSHVLSKFNLWNKELLEAFGRFVGGYNHLLVTETRKSITSLEGCDLNLSSVTDLIHTVTTVQDKKQSYDELKASIAKLTFAEGILHKSLTKLPDDFVFVDQVQTNVDVLEQLIDNLSSALISNSGAINKAIENECGRLQKTIMETNDSWLKIKPSDDVESPEVALNQLDMIEKSLIALDSKRSKLVEACNLLGLPVIITHDLSGVLEELADLKSVWGSLRSLWSSLSDLKNMAWSSLKPRSLKKLLDDLLTSAKSMPVRIRQHKPFQKFLSTITELLHSQKILISLKEDFVKERHIKSIFKQLGVPPPLELTLGDIWSLNLTLHESVVKSTIDLANSERAIEEELQKIKDVWEAQTFDYFEKKGHSLIKNFPVLLQLSSEHISSLTSMRNSPVFKTFENDILHWETTLNTFYQIVDIWILVQRQWIDLEGVFDIESGIRKLLPLEYNRFHAVSSEYQIVLKKIHRAPLAIDTSSMEDILGTFERLSEALVRVSKALSDFLEKQRELCARLYFVGNDDLIDMIANKQNVGNHLKKMFAGVSNITYNESGDIIEAVTASNGEVLNLQDPISLHQYPRLDEWLNRLELEIKLTLSALLNKSLSYFNPEEVMSWYSSYPVQIMILTLQVWWSRNVELAISNDSLPSVHKVLIELLNTITQECEPSTKKASLIIELVHQKDVVEALLETKHLTAKSFQWLKQQRFYFDSSSDPLRSLCVVQNSKSIIYGFEYLGEIDKLVYTPLLNNCFISMTSAVDQGLGGALFGPAGTGKTESIKCLGHNLGKMVFVFNCDESFDFQAISRLLSGICQIGGFGCFDEFNRLEKNILSAVSSQLQNIELSIKGGSKTVNLLNKETTLAEGTGIFVTMNPEYSGRTELPDNLKKLFRQFSVQRPDSEIISSVLLRARGFVDADKVAASVVQLFRELSQNSSQQKHYDFGLRALKSCLEHCATIKTLTADASIINIVVKAMNEMILPRLVPEDVEVYESIKSKIFEDFNDLLIDDDFKNAVKSVATSQNLFCNDQWLKKSLQLYKIQQSKQGVILVGEAGCGKTVLWKTLLKALSLKSHYTHYCIDPKVVNKTELFGWLDPITREWTDGIFTSIIRKLNDNLRGQEQTNCWIVFDGDIDPIWVETLNSVLDDNKVLTLPNGERLPIPPEVRFLFEVSNLEHATPATISRCGMVWMESGLVSTDGVVNYELCNFLSKPIEKLNIMGHEIDEFLNSYASYLRTSLVNLEDILNFCLTEIPGVMWTSKLMMVHSLFIFIRSLIYQVISEEIDPPVLTTEYFKRSLILALTWALVGNASSTYKMKFINWLASSQEFKFDFPTETDKNVLDYELNIDGSWESLISKVVEEPLDANAISNPNTVIETVDTLRHRHIVYSVLQQKMSLILCGPPGSGKTMTLYSALREAPDIDLCNMNFSKDTTPTSVLRSLEQFCEYKQTPEGIIFRPKIRGKSVVLFADEINLPRKDDYGTQPVISFLRSLVEKNGFWRTKHMQWVRLVDIQFVGACNPPTDIGRVELSPRFLWHLPVIMVDHPGPISLVQIYTTFNTSILKIVPQLSGYSKDLTGAMLAVYNRTISHMGFKRSHYIYSPRELTRWIRGIYSALRPNENIQLADLVRLWAHEGLRLFSDRLVEEDEKSWTWKLLHDVAAEFFPMSDLNETLKRPILYSDWLSLTYDPVSPIDITNFIRERLNVFSDEVLDTELILYTNAVDHILRIDRVLKQPQGHLILVGPSSSGKTTLTKFVAWINGLKIHQLSVRRNYTLSDFDNTLKVLLKKAGIQAEKICLIVDESTILESSFLERMNSLLANSQIQEIFEQDEYTMLLNACREQINSRGLLLDTDDEVYSWFTEQISANLHVVFTISEPDNARASSIIASPALFNRCVLNWMGQWSEESIIDVIKELLRTVAIDNSTYEKPLNYNANSLVRVDTYRDAVLDCILYIHKQSSTKSPGKLIELVKNFVKIYDTKGTDLSSHQAHINSGLVKLKETMIRVKSLKDDLTQKEKSLLSKEAEARATLDKILSEQNEAERKQEASIEIQAILEKQDAYIEERRKIVMEDLALAEPAVLEARRGVQNIKKQHLTELRSMSTPPAMVQLVLESVCVLLGYQVQTWRDVQSVIRKDDFIASIVTFDCERQVSEDVRQFMSEQYLSRPDYNYAAAERASKACGPLLQWVEAQIKYAVVLGKIGPLRQEVELLEQESNKTEARLMAADDMIRELSESINKYKVDYSVLIRETENIKANMTSVELSMKRSVELVESLSSERERWVKSIKDFDIKYLNLCGSALLAAACVTHSGALDQKSRLSFVKSCKEYLSCAGVTFDKDFKLTSFLNTPSNLLHWQENGLPNDDIFMENITILETTSKTPFIIDPYGNILECLSSKMAPKKMTTTSFLDDGFTRTLENSLRFGGCLVIQDAEYFDPIIAPLLNGDFHKVGGRTIVTFGDKDIDCSKTFELFLHTRNTTIKPVPFVSTRTSIIDFTITDSSLISRSLNMTLSSEAPEVEEKRVEIIKLEGEYKVRLKELEESLLTSLSESKDDLLSNTSLIETLETLKKEAFVIETKIQETDEVMEKVNDIAVQYDMFVRNVVLVYGILCQLTSLDQFYQISLSSFISCIGKVLAVPRGSSQKTRTLQLVDELYRETFSCVSVSLKNKDILVFGLSLSLLYLSETDGVLFARFSAKLLIGVTSVDHDVIREAFDLLSIKVDQSTVDDLFERAQMSDIDASLEEFKPFIRILFSKDESFEDAIAALSSNMHNGGSPFTSKYTFGDIVYSNSGKPIIMGSTSGFDASSKVRALATESGKNLKIISMGSKESAELATRELVSYCKTGTWLLIQNVQTSQHWLQYLEKRLENLVLSDDFRLFLTCDCDSDMPSTLLRSSQILVFENPPGVKTVMKEYFALFSARDGLSVPQEKSYVFFLLSWYHTLIQEASRFVPATLSKNYHFDDSDFEGALFVIDRWFETVYPGRTSVSPEKIDWLAIQTLVTDIIYGGKVTSTTDLHYLKCLGEKLLTMGAFEDSFNMIENDITSPSGLRLLQPQEKSLESYEDWINNLPDLEPPSWLGLERVVEIEMTKKKNIATISQASELFESVIT